MRNCDVILMIRIVQVNVLLALGLLGTVVYPSVAKQQASLSI